MDSKIGKMNFIVKDLMISVLPAKFNPSDVESCGACTSDSAGPPCSGACPGTRDPIPDPFAKIQEMVSLEGNPVVLADLKQQLHKQLAAVESRTEVVHKAMRPASEADVSMLKARLSSALDELNVSVSGASLNQEQKS